MVGKAFDGAGEIGDELGPGQQLHIELPISEESSPTSRVAGVITAEQSWSKDRASTALELP